MSREQNEEGRKKERKEEHCEVSNSNMHIRGIKDVESVLRFLFVVLYCAYAY